MGAISLKSPKKKDMPSAALPRPMWTRKLASKPLTTSAPSITSRIAPAGLLGHFRFREFQNAGGVRRIACGVGGTLALSTVPESVISTGAPELKSFVKVPANALELSNAKPKHDVARHRLGVYICRIKGVPLGGECNEPSCVRQIIFGNSCVSCIPIPATYVFDVNSGARKSCKAFLQIVCLICFFVILATNSSTKAAELSLDGVVDLAGKTVSLSDSQQFIVFIFLSVDCPISNRYAPTLRKLQNDFQNARWILVYPNADEDSVTIQNSLREFELSFEAWRDTQHTLVSSAKASVTPEAAVYVPAAGFIYRGRIDDRHVDFGKYSAEARTNDLRDILVEIEKGKTPSPRVTKPMGCSIPKLKE